MLELRRVSKVCGQGTQRAEAAVMRAQRTANEPTLSRAYSAMVRSGFGQLVMLRY
jgi:hypothetical protein